MSEMIMLPNAEMLVVQHLKAELTALGQTVTVATTVPATRPPKLVRVTVTGGDINDLVIANSLIAIECWGPSPIEASDLGRQAQAILNAWPGQIAGSTFVYDCQARIPASFPDPDTRTPRYVFTAVLSLRAQPI